MGFRTISVAGLPDEVVVRRSTRRRRTVGAHREGQTTIVTVPERMPLADVAEHALALHQRLLRKSRQRQMSDSSLTRRAAALQIKYLPEAPAPASVNWSTRQLRRWGSCTPADRTIRLSDRLRDAPPYVIDYVLMHELAHLLVPDHGTRFSALLERFPDLERAQAFLAGVEFASAYGGGALVAGDSDVNGESDK